MEAHHVDVDVDVYGGQAKHTFSPPEHVAETVETKQALVAVAVVVVPVRYLIHLIATCYPTQHCLYCVKRSILADWIGSDQIG